MTPAASVAHNWKHLFGCSTIAIRTIVGALPFFEREDVRPGRDYIWSAVPIACNIWDARFSQATCFSCEMAPPN